MDSIVGERDIVIVTGCNAVGKTTASNYLRKLVRSHGLPCENRIISDSQCLFQAMLEDDKDGGLHHTHDCYENTTKGHTHNFDQPPFPFTITDNELPDRMRHYFFPKLETLPRTGNLWFAEWAAGVNTNPPENLISRVDYSYKKIDYLLREGDIPSTWLKRVKVVIHLKANYDVRRCLNEQRTIPSFARPEALEQGTASWLKDERVLRFYGDDDFFEIDSILRNANIPIYTFTNNGGPEFFNLLENTAKSLFSSSPVEPVLIPA